MPGNGLVFRWASPFSHRPFAKRKEIRYNSVTSDMHILSALEVN